MTFETIITPTMEAVDNAADFINSDMSFLLYSEQDDVVVGVYRIGRMHENTAKNFASLIEQFTMKYNQFKVILNPNFIDLIETEKTHVCTDGSWYKFGTKELDDWIKYNALRTPSHFNAFDKHHDVCTAFRELGQFCELRDTTVHYIYHLKDLVGRLLKGQKA